VGCNELDVLLSEAPLFGTRIREGVTQGGCLAGAPL
jgi:hypothetical protein